MIYRLDLGETILMTCAFEDGTASLPWSFHQGDQTILTKDPCQLETKLTQMGSDFPS
jgi:hypothetical protein